MVWWSITIFPMVRFSSPHVRVLAIFGYVHVFCLNHNFCWPSSLSCLNFCQSQIVTKQRMFIVEIIGNLKFCRHQEILLFQFLSFRSFCESSAWLSFSTTCSATAASARRWPSPRVPPSEISPRWSPGMNWGFSWRTFAGSRDASNGWGK